jgi:hypothetical protein
VVLAARYGPIRMATVSGDQSVRVRGCLAPRCSDMIPVTAVERPYDRRDGDHRARRHEVFTIAGAAHARRSTMTATIWPSRQIGQRRSDTPVGASTRS